MIDVSKYVNKLHLVFIRKNYILVEGTKFKMRFILVLVVLISAFAKVNCHGGLAVPFMWTDETGNGDSQTRFGGNGCRSKALEPITKEKAQSLTPTDNAGTFGKFIRRLSHPNCYFLVSNKYLNAIFTSRIIYYYHFGSLTCILLE